MKVSKNWLDRYIPCKDVDDKDIERALTMSGTKVESVENECTFTNVVVGKVVDIYKHPNADKLFVVQLDVKEETPLQIITGAQNVFKGAVVPIARSGANLGAIGKKITEGLLRDLMSYGMLCSYEEIGIPADRFPQKEDGILIFPEEFEEYVGCDLEKVLELDNSIFDLEITPNRQDCQGTKAIARELGVVIERAPKVDLSFSKQAYEKAVSNVQSLSVTDVDGKEYTVDVEIKSPDCQRFMLAKLDNVNMDADISDIKKDLNSIGKKTINPLVDVTNFVLEDIGYPSHVYDFSSIVEIAKAQKDFDGKNIHFTIEEKTAKDVTTLDETVVDLENDLCICVNGKEVALAGVMGLANSAVKDDTKVALLEVGSFKRKKLRQTARKLNLRTDAYNKFEKRLPTSMQEEALTTALNIFDTYKIANVDNKVVDVMEKTFKPIQREYILLDDERIRRILGADISKEQMVDIFTKLYFDVKNEGDNVYIRCPYFRADFSNIQDAAEEVIRIYGYEALGCTLPKVELANPTNSPIYELNNKIKETLVDFGYNQILTYGFISQEDIQKIDKEIDLLSEDNTYIKVLNELSKDYEVMRKSMIPSMLKTIAFNKNKNAEKIKLFEIGKTYTYINGVKTPDAQSMQKDFENEEGIWTEEEKTSGQYNMDKYLENVLEENVLSIATTLSSYTRYDQRLEKDFFKKDGSFANYTQIPIFQFKKDFETLLKKLGIKRFMYAKVESDVFNQSQSISYKIGRDTIATMGMIHPNVQKAFGIKDVVYFGEINLDKVLKYKSNATPTYKGVSIFPPVKRDLSLVVPNDVTYMEIASVINKQGKKLVDSIEVFDIYKDQTLENAYSLALTISLQDQNKTLEESQITSIMDSIVATLQKQLNVTLREI